MSPAIYRPDGFASPWLIVNWIALGLSLSMFWAAAAGAQPAGELFPQPFVAEHYVVQIEQDGTRYVSESVEDHYFGSWLVSKRPDGTRSVLDLARRQVTEIRPDQGVYWTVGFSRLAELQRRLERLDELPGARLEPVPEKSAEAGEARLSTAADLSVTDETSADVAAPLKSSAPALSTAQAPGSLHGKSGVRHLRVARDMGDDSSLEKAEKSARDAADVWVDPSIKLTPAARDALAAFERDALGGEARTQGGLSPGALMKAVREHADGAFPVRTRRPVAGGVLESITTRLEPLEQVDLELVRVPEGLRRVAHPLEQAVAFMEKEAERMDLMGSMPQ